jgi:adenylylsulfate kinase
MIIQFTGLSGSGKSTLAGLVSTRLEANGYPAVVLDGDELRQSISSGLGFSRADRIEHLRRVGELASGFQDKVVLLAVINPFEESRNNFKEKHGAHLVWLRCAVETVIRRDVKGLYHRALNPQSAEGHIPNLTGVNSPFEIPAAADLILDTGREDETASADRLYHFILDKMAIR